MFSLLEWTCITYMHAQHVSHACIQPHACTCIRNSYMHVYACKGSTCITIHVRMHMHYNTCVHMHHNNIHACTCIACMPMNIYHMHLMNACTCMLMNMHHMHTCTCIICMHSHAAHTRIHACAMMHVLACIVMQEVHVYAYVLACDAWMFMSMEV